MAAATITTKAFVNVNGSFRQKIYPNVSIAATGDTLQTNLKVIYSANWTNTAISNATFSGGLITFTSTGAVNNFALDVLGR